MRRISLVIILLLAAGVVLVPASPAIAQPTMVDITGTWTGTSTSHNVHWFTYCPAQPPPGQPPPNPCPVDMVTTLAPDYVTFNGKAKLEVLGAVKVEARFTLIGQLPQGATPFATVGKVTSPDTNFQVNNNWLYVNARPVVGTGSYKSLDPGQSYMSIGVPIQQSPGPGTFTFNVTGTINMHLVFVG